MVANVNPKAPLIMVSVALGFVCGSLVSFVIATSSDAQGPASAPSANATRPPRQVASPALVTVAPAEFTPSPTPTSTPTQTGPVAPQPTVAAMTAQPNPASATLQPAPATPQPAAPTPQAPTARPAPTAPPTPPSATRVPTLPPQPVPTRRP